jgi:hypothetical protein
VPWRPHCMRRVTSAIHGACRLVISAHVRINYFIWQLLFVTCRSHSSAVWTVGFTGTLARHTNQQEVTTGSGKTKYLYVRTYKAFTPTQKPTSQHVQLTYRLAISHVTSVSHTTKAAIVRRHQRRMLSVAVRH